LLASNEDAWLIRCRLSYPANYCDKSIITDMRSTLHWEPNIITDAAGKATVTFKAAEYTVTIEGADMDGQLSFGTGQIKVR